MLSAIPAESHFQGATSRFNSLQVRPSITSSPFPSFSCQQRLLPRRDQPRPGNSCPSRRLLSSLPTLFTLLPFGRPSFTFRPLFPITNFLQRLAVIRSFHPSVVAIKFVSSPAISDPCHQHHPASPGIHRETHFQTRQNVQRGEEPRLWRRSPPEQLAGSAHRQPCR